jgi:hypothetical protein
VRAPVVGVNAQAGFELTFRRVDLPRKHERGTERLPALPGASSTARENARRARS